MIYMEPDSLGWRPMAKSWLNTLPATFNDVHKQMLNDMFERFVDPAIALIRKKTKVRQFLLPGRSVSETSRFGDAAICACCVKCRFQVPVRQWS